MSPATERRLLTPLAIGALAIIMALPYLQDRGATQGIVTDPTPRPAVWTGPTVPTSDMGIPGDVFIDTVDPVTLFGPKQPPANWGSGISLQGPAGSPGAAGPKGDTGTAGANGAPGAAATIAVGTVTTGAPGSSATITNVGTSGAAVFNFALPRGDVGAAGSPGATGATGPAGFGTVTPSTPSRVLGTAFRPSTTNAVRVTYTIRAQVTNPLLVGTSTASVSLLSDASATPTTLRDRVGAESGVGITVTIQLTTANTASLTYIVPAGHYVLLSSSVTGTGSTSIIAQVEEVLG